MKYVDNLYEWAEGVYEEFCADSERVGEIHNYKTGITIVYDLRTGETAFSKCRKDEKFIDEVGVAIAYTRLKGREVPQVRKAVLVKNLTVGDKFVLWCMPRIEYNVVGVNPIKPTEMIVICEIDNMLHRFDFNQKVYKID